MFRRHREAADRRQEAEGLGQECAVAQRGGLLPGHSVVLTLQVEGDEIIHNIYTSYTHSIYCRWWPGLTTCSGSTR